MNKHTAGKLLKQFLFWQRETQVRDGEDRRVIAARFRGFVEACGFLLDMEPSGTDAGDALAVFDRLREIAGVRS
jgi:hypothetical protein